MTTADGDRSAVIEGDAAQIHVRTSGDDGLLCGRAGTEDDIDSDAARNHTSSRCSRLIRCPVTVSTAGESHSSEGSSRQLTTFPVSIGERGEASGNCSDADIRVRNNQGCGVVNVICQKILGAIGSSKTT